VLVFCTVPTTKKAVALARVGCPVSQYVIVVGRENPVCWVPPEAGAVVERPWAVVLLLGGAAVGAAVGSRLPGTRAQRQGHNDRCKLNPPHGGSLGRILTINADLARRGPSWSP